MKMEKRHIKQRQTAVLLDVKELDKNRQTERRTK
jgi:hypothetical protein